MIRTISTFSFAALTLLFVSCGDSAKDKRDSANDTARAEKKIIEKQVDYTAADGTVCKGYVVYDESSDEKRRAVLVVPEWWGCNDYARMRAKMLAELGYIALAVDMYGNGRQAADPTEAKALATPFYQDPKLALARLEAAAKQLKSYPQTDAGDVFAIGYCFGGSMILNGNAQGLGLKGLAAFHASLGGLLPQEKGEDARMLICHGQADSFVKPEDVRTFKSRLDSSGVKYTFIEYPDATHAFTNPEATEKGEKFKMPIRYNEAADKKSWEDLRQFFAGAK